MKKEVLSSRIIRQATWVNQYFGKDFKLVITVSRLVIAAYKSFASVFFTGYCFNFRPSLANGLSFHRNKPSPVDSWFSSSSSTDWRVRSIYLHFRLSPSSLILIWVVLAQTPAIEILSDQKIFDRYLKHQIRHHLYLPVFAVAYIVLGGVPYFRNIDKNGFDVRSTYCFPGY